MIHVVGGTYHEICREPRWDQLFGSGLRAAAALNKLSGDVHLSTYVATAHRPTFDAYALEYEHLSTHPEDVAVNLQFSYTHGLARPWIDPPLHLITSAEPLHVEAPVVLRFGILEGDAVVHATHAVYDPQSAYDPRPFRENGSTADHLAIVANLYEGRTLTGERDNYAVGRALLEREGADVVVIKRGASGVRVFEAAGVSDVPAFRTERVFPIGSGDVFSAVFAHYWAELHIPASEAALYASRAAAWYCGSRRLPVPDAASVAAVVQAPIQLSGVERRPCKVYLAGPFFTTAQRWLIEEARDGLMQQGMDVFSPYHDVGIGPAEEVAPKDIAGLDQSDAVFAIVDGFDAGTLFEVGYARSKGIPVIAFVQNASPEPLKMLVGTGCEQVSDFVTAVYHTTWAALER